MSASASDRFPEWQRKIKLLTDSVWRDAKLNQAKIDQWLENFTGKSGQTDAERKHAFYLLQQFIFFGKDEVYECLRVLFRDHFVYPTIQKILQWTSDPDDISRRASAYIESSVRFVGVGFPAESGQSFLYHFRLANDLPTRLFPSPSDVIRCFRDNRNTLRGLLSKFSRRIGLILRGGAHSAVFQDSFVPPSIRHVIFLDDFCATGQQVEERVGIVVRQMRKLRPEVRISYYLPFATAEGIENVRKKKIFDEVTAAIVFDKDYKAFGLGSHFYSKHPADISQAGGEAMAKLYGSLLLPRDPLGYGNSQLLVAFEHNTPDNTLPLFWATDQSLPWNPIFPRAHKH